VTRRFHLRASFPDPATSRRIAWRNLLFPYLNPTFGYLTAVLYAMAAWAGRAPIGSQEEIGGAIYTALVMSVQDPFRAFWSVSTLLGFWLFTDTHSKRYRLVAGLLHGISHLAAIFLLGWGALYLTESVMGIREPLTQTLITVLIVGFLGWWVGPVLMGIYLLISLNVFSRHDNEAFSGLAIEDYKQFLRMKIDPDGTLTIFPVGVRRVPRFWKPRPEGSSGPVLVPDDGRATPPELIEEPIVLRGKETSVS
jgi:hypothetical protein